VVGPASGTAQPVRLTNISGVHSAPNGVTGNSVHPIAYSTDLTSLQARQQKAELQKLSPYSNEF